MQEQNFQQPTSIFRKKMLKTNKSNFFSKKLHNYDNILGKKTIFLLNLCAKFDKMQCECV